jgi:DNA polymerase III sliding clamp (beta) subunit (PCNA family)
MVDLPEVVGQYLLPFKQVAKLLAYVPGNDVVTIEMLGKHVSLSWSDGSASFEADDPKDYPVIPQIEPRIKHEISADLLVPNLVAMLDYCAESSERPVLSGVSLFLGDQLEIAAGDGFRMAYKTLPASLPSADGLKTVILPAKAIDILEHLWRKAPRPVPNDGSIQSVVDMVTNKGLMQVEISSILFKAQFGIVTLLIKTIQGTPPNFKTLIPTTVEQNEVQLIAPDLDRALGRLAISAKDGNGIVRMLWDNGRMQLSAEAGANNVETTIPVHTPNGGGRIAVHIKYLQEYIKGKTGLVTIKITTPTSPVVFRYSQAPLVAIMPMQASWPDQAPPAPVAELSAPAQETETKEEEEPGDGDPQEEEAKGTEPE